MIQDARVYLMMVENDRAVPMIDLIDQIMDALLDHDLIGGPLKTFYNLPSSTTTLSASGNSHIHLRPPALTAIHSVHSNTS